MNFICRIVFSTLFSVVSSLSYCQQNKPGQKELLRQSEISSETPYVSFATASTRFSQQGQPGITRKNIWNPKAWKNEKIHTQIVVYSKNRIPELRVVAGDLTDGKGHTIKKDRISIGFVRYVMTDEFRGGCGYRDSKNFDSSYVADIIDTDINEITVNKNTTQPIWLSIQVPADAVAGNYKGTVTISTNKKYHLQVALTVINKELPGPQDWKYDLDLWQHPAAIARIHKVPIWSDAHFSVMKKYYTMLANAGQKNITASIVNEPWGHQTYDDYPSLIKWTKKKNGEWSYDYSLFDKYIAFVMDCGIKGRINCYSMVPWKIAFNYYDEGLQRDTIFSDAIGTPAYNAFWSVMLTDFTKHLKEKKWFAITSIAMDERPMPAMQAVIALLKSIDKEWKIALAGDYHPEIENDIYNYCVASRWQYPDTVLARRKQQEKISTWYTCCTEKFPNGFTFSPPDEHVWLGWYTAAHNMDGYLRWAFNSWTKDPLADSRFTAWPAGDTYQVYPGPLSSIRFEKMIEGIQDFEKIEILRKEYKANNEAAKLDKLEKALGAFEIKNIESESAELMVEKYKELLLE